MLYLFNVKQTISDYCSHVFYIKIGLSMHYEIFSKMSDSVILLFDMPGKFNGHSKKALKLTYKCCPCNMKDIFYNIKQTNFIYKKI